jgi:hypothetical protein
MDQEQDSQGLGLWVTSVVVYLAPQKPMLDKLLGKRAMSLGYR